MLRRAAAAVVAFAASSALFFPAQAASADELRDAQQPMFKTLSVEKAWQVTRGAGVTVAVVDSGVDTRQPDLKGVVTTGPNMLAEIDEGTKPHHDHGTGMSTLIAGRGRGPGKRDGVMGIAPQAKILAIRAIAEPEDASYQRYKRAEESKDPVAEGIKYAADHGADVINLSIGEYQGDPAEREAIGYAIGKGVVVVAAAGNDGDKKRRLDKDGFAPYSYPASYPGVIAVAATTPEHERAPFSNLNYSAVVAAPGTGLPAGGPNGIDYISTDGTSDSTALVSGIAALIRARHPRLPPALVAQALITSAKPGVYRPDLGFGEVNAAKALAASDALTAPRDAVVGKPGGDRFADDEPQPVAIIDRPAWVRPVIIIVAVLGVAGIIAAAAIALALHRRNPARPVLLAPPPPTGPPPMAPFRSYVPHPTPLGPPPSPPVSQAMPPSVPPSASQSTPPSVPQSVQPPPASAHDDPPSGTDGPPPSADGPPRFERPM
ncbi:S8 family serine peptidase [Actinomadura barringtoniae]|uniref:S8 family serine peptidase n=1 Tax=Actinomadura barringtoniae TaxID=1427535 RepID=A0A939T6N0_9ACTN|nr:S8 family serine peptidase [Actinomadura barringtoniae]MBO2455136.1 S8 family serine peptidase [Actinomadura barringtoniae]